MMENEKIIHQIKLDEKNHVEEPFLKQLESFTGLKWKVVRLEMGPGQTPQETQREKFTEVIMRKDLESALKKINPWLDDQQEFIFLRALSKSFRIITSVNFSR